MGLPATPALLACFTLAVALAGFVPLATGQGAAPHAEFTWWLPPHPNTVNFDDASTSPSDNPINSWTWDFGDGGEPFYLNYFRNTSHDYARPGSYRVMLTVWAGNRNDTISHIVEVPAVWPTTPPSSHDATPLQSPSPVLQDASSGGVLGMPVVVAAPAAVAAGSAAAVGAAVALYEPFRWRWLGLFAPLYTRLARREILESQLREAIHGYIETSPGAHFRQIQKDLQLHNGTMLYHIAVLEREQYVTSKRDGMYKRYYATGSAPPPPGADPLAEQVQGWVAAHPGATNAGIAEALGKRPSLIHYHVARLVERGIVRKERDGRDVRVWPVP